MAIHIEANYSKKLGLTVVDYDIQETCGERLEKSPLSGQPCYLTHY